MKHAARAPSLQRLSGTWPHRQLRAAAASLNILLLMTANLVGFVLGVDGALTMLKQVRGGASGMGGVLLGWADLFRGVLWLLEVP